MTKGDKKLLQEVANGDRDPYAEGAEAAMCGYSDTDNPYPITSDAHLSWNDGYISESDPDEG
jgi:hypothetical protein